MKVHSIQTGQVKVKEAQRARRPGGMLSVLFSSEWSEWLPIYAWVVEHPEGVIVVDTGETARTAEPDYFTSWHPYFKMAARMRVRPEDEIGPQLRRLGIDPRDVSKVVMTHMHTDHAGGLHHFPEAEILASAEQLDLSAGLTGKLQGYLPQHRPSWFDATPVRFKDGPFGPFDAHHRLTADGDVVLVPTPGHTPGHLSVVVNDGDVSIFLAGDVSYTESHLLRREVDGVGPDAATTLDTFDRVLTFASERPTVYLPSHDPGAGDRLRHRRAMSVARFETA